MKYSKTLSQEAAADKAGMSLRTARKYLKADGQMGQAKEWKYRQTHKDIFADVFPEIEGMLTLNPGLQAQTLMQWLIDDIRSNLTGATEGLWSGAFRDGER